MKNKIMLLIIFILGMTYVQIASADLQLNSIQFDPAIIAAGDEVDIVVQFNEVGITSEDKIGNKDYTFEVILEPDDTLTEEYVTIQDAKGDDVKGIIFGGEYYNRRFRIKVMNNAPAGNYEFKLIGQWYYKGKKEGSSQYLRFKMPVKKEGIILDISTYETVPAEVRPGENYVKIVGFVENTGEKDAKVVEVNLKLPEGIDSSYTNNNRIWVGRVNAGENKKLIFFVDIDDVVKPDTYNMDYHINYMDVDDNQYQKTITLPFLIKERPYIEVVESVGEGKAGETAKLYVKVKNTGTESAEAVDVRILKQSSQPFNFDVRSDYIGELEPEEEGTAIFDIAVNSDAEIKTYDFKVLIRSKGDSDEGDDNIYTYNRRAQLKVTGKATNKLLIYGLIGGAILILLIIINMIFKRRKRR